MEESAVELTLSLELLLGPMGGVAHVVVVAGNVLVHALEIWSELQLATVRATRANEIQYELELVSAVHALVRQLPLELATRARETQYELKLAAAAHVLARQFALELAMIVLELKIHAEMEYRILRPVALGSDSSFGTHVSIRAGIE